MHVESKLSEMYYKNNKKLQSKTDYIYDNGLFLFTFLMLLKGLNSPLRSFSGVHVNLKG